MSITISNLMRVLDVKEVNQIIMDVITKDFPEWMKKSQVTQISYTVVPTGDAQEPYATGTIRAVDIKMGTRNMSFIEDDLTMIIKKYMCDTYKFKVQDVKYTFFPEQDDRYASYLAATLNKAILTLEE